MRLTFLAIAATLASSLVSAQTYSYEQGTYRQGATYSVSQTGDAATCSANCGEDSACLAWSYQRETGLGPARCELKSSLGRSQPNPLMVSGIAPRIANQGVDPAPRAQDGLLGGPADTIVRAGVARSAPALAVPPTPTRKPLSTPEVQIIVPVAAPSAAPDIAPEPAPEPAPTPVASTAAEPSPSAARISDQPRTPYDSLGSRIYPEYSVTRDATTPPAEPTIVEDLDLDTEDLASDIAEPLVRSNAEERRREQRED